MLAPCIAYPDVSHAITATHFPTAALSILQVLLGVPTPTSPRSRTTRRCYPLMLLMTPSMSGGRVSAQRRRVLSCLSLATAVVSGRFDLRTTQHLRHARCHRRHSTLRVPVSQLLSPNFLFLLKPELLL